MLNDEVISQLKASQEVVKIFDKVLFNTNTQFQDIILATYASAEVRSLYDGLRSASSLQKGHTRTSEHRRILMFPNAVIYNFLHDYFTPIYGENWLSDKKILRKVCINEELIKPWLCVKSL